ncbi:hypothetical protein H5410_022074 [Solanum commersonii]|uniref:Uncharacterized protein n=1 Tax=Solanum commersonii TaxID=4109 RepID=A0A9J5ZD52_SOLCO|nr:hypothetical protein H5410_022074 [Solanum commersonii]
MRITLSKRFCSKLKHASPLKSPLIVQNTYKSQSHSEKRLTEIDIDIRPLSAIDTRHFLELCGYTKKGNEVRDIKDMLDRMIMQLANFSVRQNQIEEQYEKSFAKLKESLDVVKKMRKGRTMKIQSELKEIQLWLPMVVINWNGGFASAPITPEGIYASYSYYGGWIYWTHGITPFQIHTGATTQMPYGRSQGQLLVGIPG